MKLITLTKIKRTLIDVEENAINASLAPNGDRDGKLRKVQDGINKICDIINNEINKKKGRVNEQMFKLYRHEGVKKIPIPINSIVKDIGNGVYEIIVNFNDNQTNEKLNDNFQFDCFCSARQLGFSITPTNKIIINDCEKFKDLFFRLAQEYLKMTNENKI